MHIHMFTERGGERMCVRRSVFVLHASELGASSAGLIVAVQRPPVCPNNTGPLISLAGWETRVYSICVAKNPELSTISNAPSQLCQHAGTLLKIDNPAEEI